MNPTDKLISYGVIIWALFFGYHLIGLWLAPPAPIPYDLDRRFMGTSYVALIFVGIGTLWIWEKFDRLKEGKK